MEVTVDVGQVNKLAVDFGAAGPAVSAGVRVIVQKTCADTKRDGQAFCPVDTGYLRSTITYDVQAARGGVSGEVGPSASYGAFVEHGTSRMAPQAYMGPAFDRNTPGFVAANQALAEKAGP